MSTRLDRLFSLLESGSNAGTRRAAALQLGEVQKLHPHELKSLLTRLLALLRSPSWDTRVAAGQAIAAVAENVPEWNPVPAAKPEFSDQVDLAPGKMVFVDFDIDKVIANGAQLLGSEGREYDCDDPDPSDLSTKRAKLTEHMGMSGFGEKAGLGAFASDMIQDDDLVSVPSCSRESLVKTSLSNMWMQTDNQRMSARERNRYKRKLKTSISRSLSVDESSLENESEISKKSKVYDDSSDVVSVDIKSEESENGSEEVKPTEWPFARLLEDLCGDLFHSDWRIRHGAATGIREILLLHGTGAGKATNRTAEQMSAVNSRWLEDVALRLLCVLALDRFGDFVSYEVVAPVRESCAQALGTVVRWMPQVLVDQVVECLLRLMQQTEWQARHGGLLGIKYVLVVKQNLVSELFPKVYSVLVGSLKDPIDDVCAVAAAALEAVMNEFLKVMPQEVPKVLALLWDGLLEFDDLTSWTNSFMSLLSTIVTKSDPREIISTQKPLNDLVPRLWPFLDHSSDKIRASVLQTINTLVNTVENVEGTRWLESILSDLMKRLFQRCILEDRPAVHMVLKQLWHNCLQRAHSSDLIGVFQHCAPTWIGLAMHPPSVPMDPAAFSVDYSNGVARVGPGDKHTYFAGNASFNDISSLRDTAVVRTRLLAAEFISSIATRFVEVDDSVDNGMNGSISLVLQCHFRTRSAVQKGMMALILRGLAEESSRVVRLRSILDSSVMEFLVTCLEETMPYDELASSITAMHVGCNALVQEISVAGVSLDPSFLKPVLSIEQCQNLVGGTSEKIFTLSGSRTNRIALLQKRNEAAVATQQAAAEYTRTSTRVRLCASVALVALNYTPDKLAPLIRPLMDILKRDENKLLQDLAASSLSRLMLRICDTSQPTCDKIVKNLCTYLCCDPSQTPKIDDPVSGMLNGSQPGDDECYVTKSDGILSLHNSTKDRSGGLRTPSVTRKSSSPFSSSAAAGLSEESSLEVQRNGGEAGLSAICRAFGPTLNDKLPQLTNDRILTPTATFLSSSVSLSSENAQEVVSALQTLDKIMEHLDESLHGKILEMLPTIAKGVCHGLTGVRFVTARLIASMAVVCEEDVMRFVVVEIMGKLLDVVDCDAVRQGAVEVVGCILDRLGMGIVPYIVLLTVPVMRRMTDQNHSVRLMASQCFGAMVRLMPLGMAAARKPGFAFSLQKPDDMKFLEQLLDSKKMEPFVLPVPVQAELRSYQQDGLNWLSFLNRYNLHGILCDDMGLGKTLQTICILAADHHLRSVKYQESKSPGWSNLPSLVICPSTLISHWAREVVRFVDREHLHPLQYEGSPSERIKLRRHVKNYSLVVSSYEIVKNDVEFFRDIKWNYCVLDEGHVIRNNKTRVFKAIKQLVCNHRLILSGTPVQNNVQDLWALFDFLMPGLLGTEKKFTARFAKPIDSSKDPRASSRDIEEGALAMETLHKQVLPFILRRLKSDVLKDLPPKIIQDYYCDLSPLQLRLYEDFAKSKAQKDVISSLLTVNGSSPASSSSPVTPSSHVFQAFQYLRKVCNHPALVLNEKHPKFREISRELEREKTSLFDIQHAAKFVALQQLLMDCGIGTEDSEQSVVGSHRALIFCQLTAVLEMLEQHLFRTRMPTVAYLKLDGSVPIRERQNVVERFNSDPSIDVLLLTTSIGGLGLNLTGADTVIFVEHDWNPSKDIQAMDRAHRIGQKKVVNVYRLITRGTLEEKIMGLQKFKLHVANSIITQENSALQSMGTEQIIDLFSMDSDPASSSTGTSRRTDGKVPAKGLKAALDNLEDLWDSSQYDTEYDVSRFMDSLKKSG